jgi:SH3-like domain-containing protein
VSVVNPIISPALRWLAAMATGAFVVWASLAFLAVNVAPAIQGAVVLKRDGERQPRNLGNLQPIPAGSITALAPMPTVVDKAPPATVPASVDTAVASVATAGEPWRVVSGVNVRRDASSRSPVVATLARGKTVRVIDSRRGWRLVEYESGIRGWVYGRYLTQTATVAAAQ